MNTGCGRTGQGVVGCRRQIGAWVWVLVLCAVPLMGQAVSEPFRLTITPESQTYRAGGQVVIRLIEENVSSRPISCTAWIVSATDENFRYELWDSAGKVLAPQSYIRESGSIKSCQLQPGRKLPHELLLSEKYDLSHPGEYRVQVSRHVAGGSKDDVVRSNSIIIKIVP
jgi:hypothetical protein